jgi:hypothetical protein
MLKWECLNKSWNPEKLVLVESWMGTLTRKVQDCPPIFWGLQECGGKKKLGFLYQQEQPSSQSAHAYFTVVVQLLVEHTNLNSQNERPMHFTCRQPQFCKGVAGDNKHIKCTIIIHFWVWYYIHLLWFRLIPSSPTTTNKTICKMKSGLTHTELPIQWRYTALYSYWGG